MNITAQKYGKRYYDKIVLKYMNLAYRLGSIFDRRKYTKLPTMLYQADIEMSPGMFTSLYLVTASLAAILVFVLSDIILIYVLESMIAIPLSIMMASVTFVAVISGFFFYLHNKINIKKVEIERNLPFALSYMSIMASAGSTPLKVLAALSIQNYGHISNEFMKMGYRVYFLGEDSITAINNLANNTPSKIFRDICMELSNIIHSGTGLREYLEGKSNDLVAIKRLSTKEFIEDLSMMAEGYLFIILMVILALIVIPLMGIFGLTIASLSANHLFMMFTYLLLPFVNILFLAVLEAKYSAIP